MARKSKQKPAKFQVAIVGEGISEWFYFSDMKRVENFSFKLKPDLPKHSDFKSIIRTARDKVEEGYDLVFCVLDLDRILSNDVERQRYSKEKQKKKANKNIVFTESMPCLELWFLLHFLGHFSSKVYEDYSQVVKPLKKFIPEYEKTEKFFKAKKMYAFLQEKGNPKKASEFATRLLSEKEKSDEPLYNFSNIHELLEKLKSL